MNSIEHAYLDAVESILSAGSWQAMDVVAEEAVSLQAVVIPGEMDSSRRNLPLCEAVTCTHPHQLVKVHSRMSFHGALSGAARCSLELSFPDPVLCSVCRDCLRHWK